MFITDEKFFLEELDTSIPELSNIGETFKTHGLAAAEKQLAYYIRSVLPPVAEKYFTVPYHRNGEGGQYTLPGETDREVADRVLTGDVISSSGARHKFENGVIIWEHNPTYNNYKEWTWQLNRHRSLRILGHVYKETGEEKYAEGFVRHLLSWIEQAPCPENEHGYRTKCWRTIETGIRMTDIWHYAFLACYTSPAFTDHVITTYMKSIWEHGYRLSNFYTEGNWLFMEMSGLSHIAMIYPWLKKSKEWKTQAFDTLTNAVYEQMLPDGFQFEMSSTYHGVVLDNLVRPLRTARVLGVGGTEKLGKAMTKLCDIYVKLSAPDFRIPALHDGARSGFVGYIQQALNYVDNPHYRYFASKRREGTPPPTSVALPYSGIATMRDSWEADGVWFFFDSGPFGFGTMGHQHEDKLNVLMFAYGKDVLSDPGKYEYDGSDMFHFLKDTRSHNCALVDELSQNRRAKYKYKDNDPDLRKLSDLKWSFTEEYDTAEGEYSDGYGKDFIDVTHKRKVVFFKKGLRGSLPFSLVIDRFVPNDGKEHKFAASYQLNTHPYTSEGRRFTTDHGDGVTFSIIGSSDHEVLVAQKSPIYIGWRPIFTPGEHDHAPAPCVRFPYYGKEQRLITVLYPSNNGEVAIKAVDCENSVNDTEFTLTFADGEVLTLDEKDFPCK